MKTGNCLFTGTCIGEKASHSLGLCRCFLLNPFFERKSSFVVFFLQSGSRKALLSRGLCNKEVRILQNKAELSLPCSSLVHIASPISQNYEKSPPSKSPDSSPLLHSDQKNKQKNHKMGISSAASIGIAVGSILVVCILLFWLFRRGDSEGDIERGRSRSHHYRSREYDRYDTASSNLNKFADWQNPRRVVTTYR